MAQMTLRKERERLSQEDGSRSLLFLRNLRNLRNLRYSTFSVLGCVLSAKSGSARDSIWDDLL
jgi:hypothetical protein